MESISNFETGEEECDHFILSSTHMIAKVLEKKRNTGYYS